MVVYLHSFLTSVLGGGEWTVSHTDRLLFGVAPAGNRTKMSHSSVRSIFTTQATEVTFRTSSN
jgi:hypothetical protein